MYCVIQTEPQVPELKLSDQINGLEDDTNLRIITISWQEPNITQHQIYHITVEPAIQGCNTTCETEKTEMELKLAVDTAYNVTIIAVMCNGSVQSTKSKPLQIFLNGMLQILTMYNSMCLVTVTNNLQAACLFLG